MPYALRHLPVLALPMVALLAGALALAGCKKQDGGVPGDAGPSAPMARIAAPAGKTWSDVVVRTAEGGYRMGNPGAPIKVVEYGSLTCPHCAEFSKESGDTIANDFVGSGRVSYEFRNFVRDPIDVTAALLTRCGDPASYFPLTAQVFANQTSFFDAAQKNSAGYKAIMEGPAPRRMTALGQLTGLTDFFAARGLPRGTAQACLADAGAAAALAKTTEDQSQQYDIQGTPTFLVNGDKIGTETWPEMKARLEAMGAR